MRTTVKTMSIRGAKIAISVNEDGRFGGEFGGEWYHGDTLKSVEQKLQTAARVSTADLKIPFTEVEWSDMQSTAEIELREGVGVGIHAGNNNLLVKWEGRDHTEQLRSSRDTFRFTPADRKELAKLIKVYQAAHKALKKFLDSKEISLHDELKAAVEKASTATEKPDAEGS